MAILHTDSHFTFYFGNKQTGISSQEYKQAYESKGGILPPGITESKKLIAAQQVVFLRQVHSTKGVVIDEKSLKTFNSFSVEGDFLITNVPGIAVGVLTADCLPLLIHDPFKRVISAVHAGWRGSVAGITWKAVSMMRQKFSCNIDDLKFYGGPAAKSCCYAVDDSLINQAARITETRDWTAWRDNKPFFDLALYNRALLGESGIKQSALCFDNNECTICNPDFYSYRREKEQSGRQCSLAMLR